MNAINLNPENFETNVTQSDRPVLVDFWAEWCGPCKMLNPVLNEIAGELGGRVTVAKVNVDEQPGLASRFRVQSIPTLVVFKNGAEQSRLVGLAPKKKILEQLSLN
jgi:thioredoxin 1